MSKISYSITSWVKGFYDTRNPNKFLKPDGLSLDEYESQAEQCLHTAWQTLHLPDWKLEKKCTANGDIVESCHTEQFGKIYRFTGVVDCPAAMLYKIFLKDITRLPEWNPTVERLNIIKEIADGIDISYQVTAVAGLGLIAPRDFVTLRRVATLSHDGRVTVAEPHCYISSVVSVSVPDCPPHSSMVRGQNKVGCWVLWPKTVQVDEGKSEQKTVFQWLMCCDIKGRIPQFLLDVAVTTTMMDYVGYLRKFAVECKTKGVV